MLRIGGFGDPLIVMPSKQRPRRMSLYGSNGEEDKFLLKGREDLRLDERVMQMFHLVNTLMADSAATRQQALEITRYPVIPLSNNAGLIGWVEGCDAVNTIIEQMRKRTGVKPIEWITMTKPIGNEADYDPDQKKFVAQKNDDWEILLLYQKVEFSRARSQQPQETTSQRRCG
jgi:phosphatidylinositol kinase/protein kinase (PI-3  family)